MFRKDAKVSLSESDLGKCNGNDLDMILFMATLLHPVQTGNTLPGDSSANDMEKIF